MKDRDLRPPRPDEVPLALSSAIAHLHIAADGFTQALTHLDRTASANTLGRGGGGGGPRPKGSISDPTGSAVVARLDTGRRDDDDPASRITPTDLRDRVAVIVETAWLIRHDTALALYDATLPQGDRTLDQALIDLEWANTVPHGVWTAITTLRQLDRPDDAEQLACSVACVELEARCLSAEVTTVLRSAERAERERPKPKDRQNCRNCRLHGLDVDCADGSSSLCERCKNFRGHHGAMPTEEICRAWDRGTRRVTPGQIAEAKAAARAKRKRRRAS